MTGTASARVSRPRGAPRLTLHERPRRALARPWPRCPATGGLACRRGLAAPDLPLPEGVARERGQPPSPPSPAA